MNIIKPGDVVFIALPVGHQDLGASKQFDKGFEHFMKGVTQTSFPFQVVTSSIGAPDSSPEVMFVLRKDAPKTCLCE